MSGILEVRRDHARRLRAHGWTLTRIAEFFGVSYATAQAWCDPEHAEKVRRRRERYQGRCVDCGAPTDGSNGASRAPERCAPCRWRVQHEERRWTRETVIEAIREWAAKHGRPPVATDWVRAGERHPAAASIYSPPSGPFPSWADAIEAAGFPRPRSGVRTPEGQARMVASLTKWTRETILDWITAHAENGEPPPMKTSSAVVCAACREFGSWREAVQAAGFTPREPGRRRSRSLTGAAS